MRRDSHETVTDIYDTKCYKGCVTVTDIYDTQNFTYVV